MGATFYRERVGVRSSEEVVDRRELEHLRMMARRGKDYEDAAMDMRNRFVEIIEGKKAAERIGAPTAWYEGWLAAMRELSQKIVRPG